MSLKKRQPDSVYICLHHYLQNSLSKNIKPESDQTSITVISSQEGQKQETAK